MTTAQAGPSELGVLPVRIRMRCAASRGVEVDRSRVDFDPGPPANPVSEEISLPSRFPFRRSPGVAPRARANLAKARSTRHTEREHRGCPVSNSQAPTRVEPDAERLCSLRVGDTRSGRMRGVSSRWPVKHPEIRRAGAVGRAPTPRCCGVLGRLVRNRASRSCRTSDRGDRTGLEPLSLYQAAVRKRQATSTVKVLLVRGWSKSW